MTKQQPDDHFFLQQAIDLAIQSANEKGGPFGAVIVQNGTIIGRGYNQVTENCDPSAHAEIIAIRNACKTINNYRLENCIIYASCEPCPMCMSAIYWAHIPKVIYAATSQQAALAGFDDRFIYDELGKPYQQRSISIEHVNHDMSNKSFEQWLANSRRKEY